MTDHQTSPVGEDAERAAPCPFCGESDVRIHGTQRAGYTVMCYSCGGEGPLEEMEKAAIGAWNNRAAPTQPKAQVGSIDTPEFRNLLGDLLDAYRKELQGGPMLPYEKARPKLIAYIDAWAGSRSAPAAGTVEKDAERYRWLRSQHWNDSSIAVVSQPKKSVKLGFDCPSENRLDSIIDAAIEAHNRAGKEQG